MFKLIQKRRLRPIKQIKLKRYSNTNIYSHDLHPSISHPILREWQTMRSFIQKSQFVYPIFLLDVPNKKNEIPSMPEQYQWSVDRLPELLDPLVKKGLKSVILFGVITHKPNKDCKATWADHEDGPVVKGIQFIKKRYPNVLVLADVCLCQFTDHGHCGLFNIDEDAATIVTHHKDKVKIDNEKSIKRLAEISYHYCKAGADVIAPSDMMDRRISAIKANLFEKGYRHIPVMSYSAKFASCLYGPFRDAAHSTPTFGDRKTYQLPPGSPLIPQRAIQRDIEEGADMIMIKPAQMYLDIIKYAKDNFSVPVACYQVSGEYAMIYHSAAKGSFDLKTIVLESVYSLRRAGADIILSYYTPKLLDYIDEEQKKI
jgi:porphobilinogen synthase